jgi:hypothetical protein
MILSQARYYLMVAEDQHASVRTAAVTCIGELGLKVTSDAVRPYVAAMLAALIKGLRDGEWSVRDGMFQ